MTTRSRTHAHTHAAQEAQEEAALPIRSDQISACRAALAAEVCRACRPVPAAPVPLCACACLRTSLPSAVWPRMPCTHAADAITHPSQGPPRMPHVLCTAAPTRDMHACRCTATPTLPLRPPIIISRSRRPTCPPSPRQATTRAPWWCANDQVRSNKIRSDQEARCGGALSAWRAPALSEPNLDHQQL